MSINIKGKTVYGPSIVTDGLVLYLDAANTKSYPGSGTTWYDLSGNGNNGVISSATYNSDNCGSFMFDGNSNYVTVPNHSSFNLVDNFTIILNFKSTFWTLNNQEGIFSKGNQTAYSLYLRSTGDLSFYTGPTNYWSPGPAIGGNNTWYFLTLIYSYSSLALKKMYVNGIFSSQQAITETIPINNLDLLIGLNPNIGLPRFFKGNVSIAGIYNRVLSATEILQNYNAMKGRYI